MIDRPYFASYYRWLVASQILQVNLQARRVLDVGCDDASFLQRSSATLRAGVDLAPRARPTAEIEIIQADARSLPVLDSCFDCILAFDVLEHIEHDRAVMHELLRVLTQDGALWFSTPARSTTFYPRFIHPYANSAFGHVRNGYTESQIRSLLPDQCWQLDLFYWNEPWLRAAFVPLHLLDRIAPSIADTCVRWSFVADGLSSAGVHGHLFGRITRKSSDL